MTSISQLTIVRIVSIFLLMLSAVMLIPLLIDLLDENPDWQVFAVVGGFTAFLSSYGIMITNDRPMPFNLPTGFVLINIMWVAISVVSALPYIFSDYHVSFTDAVFESVSGLTTTGSTVLSGLDDMPRGLLFWRSSTQWFGGVGFVAMGIVLLPFLQVGGMQFFKMESSDRSDKPFARIRTFGRALLAIYVIITLLCFLSYMLAGMSAFNAINHAMTTVSTGGFSTTDSSMMQQSGPVLVVGIIFMLAGAIPFTLYMSAIVGKRGRWSDGQMEVMLWIVFFVTVTIFLQAFSNAHMRAGELFLHTLFNVVSLVTTTGFASADYLAWGPQSIGLILIATFVGGCAGSTAGGFKTYRLIIMAKFAWASLRELRFPNGVFQIYVSKNRVSENALKATSVFLLLFFVSLGLAAIGLMMTGLDFDTSFSGALTALSNVGPGWGTVIGPTGNFTSFSDPAKWIMIFSMLLGRLEIMTMLVVFTPFFWKG